MEHWRWKIAVLVLSLSFTEISGNHHCSDGTYSEGQLFPSSEQCHSTYYQCVHGKALERHCSAGTIFDPSISICNRPQNVAGCGDVIDGDPCSEGTYTEGTLFPYEDCSEFYNECVHGKTLKRPCAPGTVFDEAVGVCNHPRDVTGCGDVIDGDPCSDGTYTEGTLFPYEDCSEFYNECVHGKTLKRPCAPGTVFDEAVGVCNHPRDVVGCGGGSRCNGHQHGDLYIPDDGCYPYFYQCSHGTAYKMNCPAGLIFDTTLLVCNWPSDVEGCAGEGGCNGHSHGDIYVDGDGCYSFYYQCNHGNPVKTDCGNGLIFDPTHGVCNWPHAVPGCSNDNGCHGHNHGDLYILDDNCYPYFYQCVHGKAYKMPCPDGLVFDTTLLVCNWPSQVEGCEGGTTIHTTTTTTTTSEPAPPSKGKTYVGFAIDETGSMSNEILAVKAWLKDCIHGSRFFCGHTPTGGWIVSTFNDPDSQHVVGPTTNITTAIKVIDDLRPHGGWDCPEMAMAGIKQAVEAVPDDNDGCKIFFFSDASAKDLSELPKILKLLLQKRCAFIPILSSCCGPCLWPCLVVDSDYCERHVFERTHTLRRKRSTGYQDRAETGYYSLAEKTGGDIFIIPKPKVSTVMTKILEKAVTLGPCGTTEIAGPPGDEYLCEADCIAMEMCWDRSVSRCYCSGKCSRKSIPRDKSRCDSHQGKLLCDPTISQDYFVDVAHCNSYFTCKWGKPSHHQCDHGKVFTPLRDDHCDIPQNVPGPCGNGLPYPANLF